MKPPTQLELTVDLCRSELLTFRPGWTASVMHDEPRCHQVGAYHEAILTTLIAEVRETFYGPAFCVRVIHSDQEKARFSLLCGVPTLTGTVVQDVVKQAERFVDQSNF